MSERLFVIDYQVPLSRSLITDAAGSDDHGAPFAEVQAKLLKQLKRVRDEYDAAYVRIALMQESDTPTAHGK